jgi:hypothetical protein
VSQKLPLSIDIFLVLPRWTVFYYFIEPPAKTAATAVWGCKDEKSTIFLQIGAANS